MGKRPYEYWINTPWPDCSKLMHYAVRSKNPDRWWRRDHATKPACGNGDPQRTTLKVIVTCSHCRRIMNKEAPDAKA